MRSLFQNKNFRLLVSGRLLTNIGDSMYYVAAMWLVYQLGGSAFYSGLAGFLILLPQALQFLVGPVVDSHSIKNILMLSQIAQAVLLLLIPIAYCSGVLTVWLVLTVMPLVSFLDQFSFPAENALIPSILQREERTEANSVMALAYQGTDAAFNAIGGVILALVGAVSLYLADIGTFILAAWFFKSLKLPAENQTARRKSSFTDELNHYLTDLNAGFQVVLHSVLGKVIVTGVFTNFALGAELAALPAYADVVGGSRVYGFLLAGSAIGSLAGALLAPVFSRYAIGRVLAGSYFLGFCFWLLTYALPFELLKVIFFSLSMVPLGMNNVIGYTLMQNILPRKLIARSMSVMVSVSTCIMPLGSLIGGLAASTIGAGTVFLAASTGFLFVAVYITSIPVLRRLPSAEKVRPGDYGFDAKAE
jgi:Bacterial protein of unknown function (DUF894).